MRSTDACHQQDKGRDEMKKTISVLILILVLAAAPHPAYATGGYTAKDINDFVVTVAKDVAGFLKQAQASEVAVVPYKNADDSGEYALSEVLTGALLQELKYSYSELNVLPPTDSTVSFRVTGVWKKGDDEIQVKTRIVQVPSADVEVTYTGSISLKHVPKVYIGRETPDTTEPDRGTRIAVMDFVGVKKYPDFDYLDKAIPEAITTVFAQNSDLVLIERLQIDKVKKELELAESEYTDPDTVVRIGKLLGANYVIIGSYQKSGRKLRLLARRVKVETGEVFEAASATGIERDIFELEDTLAKNLLDDIQKYR